MQITPSHELLHALGTAPSSAPARAAVTVAARAWRPGPPCPGARVNILV